MAHPTDAGRVRLEDYLEQVGDVLGHAKRRASFATYALGLSSDAERKRLEPIAARATGKVDTVAAMHQRLQHFVTDSDWDDRAVRRVAARYALEMLAAKEPVEAWILDDTGFLKQGKHSVGVQRQYTGSAGKVTNCQVGVSLRLATRADHLPVDFELFLPESWANDEKRRQEARIPDDVVFKTKPQPAIDMLRRALEDNLPRGVVPADAGYGASADWFPPAPRPPRSRRRRRLARDWLMRQGFSTQ